MTGLQTEWLQNQFPTTLWMPNCLLECSFFIKKCLCSLSKKFSWHFEQEKESSTWGHDSYRNQCRCCWLKFIPLPSGGNHDNHSKSKCYTQWHGFSGLGVSMLASGTQVRGFEPSWSCQIFQDEKILSMPSIRGEVKLSGQCRRFAACKRSLQIEWNSLFEINWAFLAHSSPFPCQRSLVSYAWGLLAVQAGTFKAGLRTKSLRLQHIWWH
jgi:hypothetical protein